MSNSFYEEWLSVWKSYKCERDPEPDPNGHDTANGGLYDAYGQRVRNQRNDSQTSIGMPDTWAVVRRLVARVTAQIPNLKFRGEDTDRSDRVSRKCMRDWDRGGVQRLQKKHVAQAGLFGWSVRAWSWETNEYTRHKRVDPLDPVSRSLVFETYGDELKQMAAAGMDGDSAVAELLNKYGRGNLLPVSYTYQGYEGPKAEFLHVADCFPEPEFSSLQKSKWFIVQRNRGENWLKKVAEAYPKELGPGITDLFSKYPKGTSSVATQRDDLKDLRRQMTEAIGRVTQSSDVNTDSDTAHDWKIIECHTPGPDPKLAYATEEGQFIGEIPYPYELEGKIAFTELVLIDDLLSGIGDSTARVMRGLQLLHDRQVNIRTDLAYAIMRPLVTCTDQNILENPDMVKRHSGLRLVGVRTHDAMRIVGEQAAMAAVAVGMQDEGAIERQIQKASGENNMSMAANVDPQQNRTATGARIMAYAADILSKDGVDMFTETSIKPDQEMIYLLNRSELAEDAKFDAAPYYRSYTSNEGVPQSDPITVSPLDFQEDVEVDAEVGSTLADDDESKISKAMTLWQMALASGGVINMEKARDRALIAKIGRASCRERV